MTPAIRRRLLALYSAIDRLTKAYGISKKGEQVWYAELDGDRFLVVRADGFGGATLLRGRGNAAGDDYLELDSRVFASEASASTVASAILSGELSTDDAFDAARTPEFPAPAAA